MVREDPGHAQDRISIIVPVRDRTLLLTELLTSIDASSTRPHEVIVVDDASSTPGIEEICTRFGARYFRLSRPSGPSAARNRGLRAATGEIVLFTDSDVRLNPDTLEHCRRFFLDHPERQVLMGVFEKEPLNPGLGPNYKALLDHFIMTNHPKDTVTELDTALFSGRRVFLQSLAGFDESYPDAGIEDNVFGYQILERSPIHLDRGFRFRHNFPDLGTNALKFFKRARDWTRLFLLDGRTDDYVSTPANALSAVAAGVSLAGAALSCKRRRIGGLLLVAGLGAFLLLNRRLIRFFVSETTPSQGALLSTIHLGMMASACAGATIGLAEGVRDRAIEGLQTPKTSYPDRPASTPPCSIRTFVPSDPAWVAYLSENPSSRFAHTPAWAEVCRALTGRDSLVLAAVRDDRIVGGVLLSETGRRLSGSRLVSGAFTSYGEVLFEDPVYREEILAAAAHKAHESGSRMEIRDTRPFPAGIPFHTRFVTQRLELEGGFEAVLERAAASRRNDLSRAKRHGLVVEARPSLEEMDRLLKSAYRCHGVPWHGIRFIESILDSFRDDARLISVRSSRGLAAVGLLVFYGRNADLDLLALAEEGRRISAGALIFEAAIREALERGAWNLDLGRSVPGSGVHHFKRRWGSDEIALYFGYPGRISRPLEFHPSSGLFKIATRLWKILPERITSSVGPPLAAIFP